MEGKSDSFVSSLFAKLAMTKEVEAVTGKNTDAAQNEALRQISQAIQGGDPVKGEGVTKSGGDD